MLLCRSRFIREVVCKVKIPLTIGVAALRFSMTDSKKQVLLFSSSRIHGSSYLEFAAKDVITFLKDNNVTNLLFVPYAIRDHEGYTQQVSKAFEDWGFKLSGIHKATDPVKAVEEAQALFIGGGNTFLLLKMLHDKGLIEPIRKRVLKDGMPYIGSSAGTNIATINICTTNDMPIVYPPTFDALGLVPFNINPHYQDSDPKSKHMGETREERILQYKEIPGTPPVVGLTEGSFLLLQGDTMMLRGPYSARIFEGKEVKEVETGTDLSYLLKIN